MTLDDLIVSIGVDTTELVDGADEGVQQANSRLGDLGKGVAGAAAGLGVGKLFSDGLNAGVELTQVDQTLKNQFGLSEKDAKAAGDIAGSVFSSGFGDSITEVGDAVGQVSQNIGGLGKVSKDTLKRMTTDALALAQTYGQDVGDVTKAAGQLLKTGLAKDGTEALDILAAGFQKGVNKSDDLLDTFNEYGTQFRKLGIDGQTALGLLSQGLQGGARDADLVADSLKEFSIRAIDGSKSTADGFKALGLNADEFAAKIGHGGKGATQALDTVLDRLRGIKDPVKQSQAAVALFGTQAEDLGKALYSIDPSTATKAIGDVAGASDKAAASATAAQSLDAIWRTVSVTIGEALQPALQWLGDFLSAHPAVIKAVAVVLLVLAVALTIAAVAQWALNSALLANPYTWIILAVVALIAAIVAIAVNWDKVVKALIAGWNAVKSGFSAAWNWLKANVFNPIGRFFTKTIPGWASSMVNYVKGKWNGLVDWFKGIPGRLSKALSGAFNGLKSAFKSAVNWVIGRWNNLSFTIGGGSVLGVSIPSVTLGTPNIPYLAKGGIATGPTLAMIGEGREDEAVLPLSKLDNMMRSGSVQRTGGNNATRVVIDVTGGDSDLKRMIRRMVRVDGRGNVQTAFG